MALTEGWIIFDSGGAHEMKIRGKWKLKQRNPDVWIEHYPGDLQTGFDLGTKERTLNLVDFWFESKADAELFLEYIDLLNATVGGWKLELQVHSDGSKFKLKGGTASNMNVLALEYSEVEKVAFGDDQLYKIKVIKVEQSS